MKRNVVTNLGMLLFTSANLVGCAADSADEIECLPGDIDCAPADGDDGKGDGFDFKNDPVRMSQRLNYRLAELPMSGTHDAGVEGSVSGGRQPAPALRAYLADLRGRTQQPLAGRRKSPSKYDAAFNNAQVVRQRTGSTDRREPTGTRTTSAPVPRRSGRAAVQGATDLHRGISGWRWHHRRSRAGR
jgi:hypothetical protein